MLRILLITLLVVSCRIDITDNNSIIYDYTKFTDVNINIAQLDEKYILEELKSYKFDGTINTYKYYDTNGRINYDYSFFLDLYPMKDSLEIGSDSLVYLHFFDYRQPDSNRLLVEYRIKDEIIFTDTVFNDYNKNGMLYKLKKFPYDEYLILLELESYSSKNNKEFVLGMKRAKWILNNTPAEQDMQSH